jgi:hypothetical protein
MHLSIDDNSDQEVPESIRSKIDFEEVVLSEAFT